MLNFIIKCANCNCELNPELISEGDFVKVGAIDGNVNITCECGNEIEFAGAEIETNTL